MLDLEDAFTGGLRHLTLQHPEVDAQGRGHMRERVLEVQIPRGVRPGQFIRLAGQGARIVFTARDRKRADDTMAALRNAAG